MKVIIKLEFQSISLLSFLIQPSDLMELEPITLVATYRSCLFFGAAYFVAVLLAIKIGISFLADGVEITSSSNLST